MTTTPDTEKTETPASITSSARTPEASSSETSPIVVHQSRTGAQAVLEGGLWCFGGFIGICAAAVLVGAAHGLVFGKAVAPIALVA
jgi:hypothetical protein